MEWVIVVILIGLLVYLLFGELSSPPIPILEKKRLCDYSASGAVFEDIPAALERGIRLLELHVYSDEQDQPVVAKRQQQEGYDFTLDNLTFEQCCIDIANDAFPSKDPLILSIVPHTNKTIVFDRIAYHLQTTVHRHLLSGLIKPTAPLQSFTNKIIIVSGGEIQGTQLEPLVNLNWNGSDCRRLSYAQALSPRDPKELTAFNVDHITIVAPDSTLKVATVNPDQPKAYGCQWNLFSKTPSGFVEKASLTR